MFLTIFFEDTAINFGTIFCLNGLQYTLNCQILFLKPDFFFIFRCITQILALAIYCVCLRILDCNFLGILNFLSWSSYGAELFFEENSVFAFLPPARHGMQHDAFFLVNSFILFHQKHLAALAFSEIGTSSLL